MKSEAVEGFSQISVSSYSEELVRYLYLKDHSKRVFLLVLGTEGYLNAYEGDIYEYPKLEGES